MAIKKSDLYSSLWASCDELRGGMDVVVHEMLHLWEPNHSERFVALLDEHYPTWREARVELNELPLAAEEWRK